MADEKHVKDWDRLIVRVPDGMKEEVERRAKVNGRSTNSEIVAMLEKALEPGRAPVRVLRQEQVLIEREIREQHERLLDLERRRAHIVAQAEALMPQGWREERLAEIGRQATAKKGGEPQG